MVYTNSRLLKMFQSVDISVVPADKDPQLKMSWQSTMIV